MFTDLKAEESIPTFYKGSCPDPIIYRQVACSSTVAIYNGPSGDLDERGGDFTYLFCYAIVLNGSTQACFWFRYK